MDMDLPKEQNQEKVVKKSSKAKSPATSLHKIKHKISKRSSESTSRQRSHKNSTKKTSNGKTDSRITFKDQKKHRLVLQEKKLPDGLELSYISKGKELLQGYTKGRGILCCCCNEVVSPTMFESHAGRTNSKKPYQHIFLSSGMSLHQYASSLKLNCRKRVESNDLLCMVCHKSGDLLFCDGCPRSFHKECTSDTINTLKKRFCRQCQLSMKCLAPKANSVKDGTISGAGAIERTGKQRIQIDSSVPKANSVKDGMVSGADPIERTGKQRIQIDSSGDQIACVLCRSYDFCAEGFSDETSIVCDQCEKEYHIGCLKKDMNVVLTELPTGDWFCTADCQSLHSFIKCVLSCGPLNAMHYMQPVKKKLGSDADDLTDLDIKWIVFNGKDACEEHKLLLTQAVDILHDCFNPIIDSVTGEDFIPSMAYGKQMGSYNFSGVYTALLTINSIVVTAGMFRIFGREIAELPVVATSKQNQGKGYFQVFLECLERFLSLLCIEKLVIPAANDAKGMWIKKFGFNRVPPRTLARYRQIQTSMVAFHGTTLLQKDVPQGCVTSVKRRVCH